MRTNTLAVAALCLPLAGVAVAARLPCAWLQEPTPTGWEYKVVGIAELHESTLDSLKSALANDEDGLLGMARAADARLAAKTQALLNEHGADGWRLLQVSGTSAVFERPLR